MPESATSTGVLSSWASTAFEGLYIHNDTMACSGPSPGNMFSDSASVCNLFFAQWIRTACRRCRHHSALTRSPVSAKVVSTEAVVLWGGQRWPGRSDPPGKRPLHGCPPHHAFTIHVTVLIFG